MKTMRKISLMISLMLLASVLMGFCFIPSVDAATLKVNGVSYSRIQDAINASSNGDLIVVSPGYYPKNVVVNKSITLVSTAGYATTWINGTVNVTVDDVQIGNTTGNGFTIYQSTITVGVRAVTIGTNASRDNIKIYRCEIKGGYDGINIGAKRNCTNVVITNDVIHGQGKSAINASFFTLKNSNISYCTCYNSSNTDRGAVLLFDGAYDLDIFSNTIHTSTDNGGEGINFTGLNNATDKVDITFNSIYDLDTYSPIIVRSKASTEYVQNMKIHFNILTNNTHGTSAPAIRFDNISGKITATNISAMFNNISSTSRDIEERFALTATYKNWTGVMKAYFNYYGSSSGGTFRNSSHLYASPYLIANNAPGDIYPSGYREITGVATTYMNNSVDADTNISLTTTDNLIVVVYPYSIGLLTNYPVRSMHKYIEFGVSDTSHVTYPVNITIYYTTTDLETRDWSERYIKGLVFYNETSAKWEEFNETDCVTNDTGSYEGYVWGLAYTPSQLAGTILGIDYNKITAGGEEEEGGTEGTGAQKDTDGDGLPDNFEESIGTNPNIADTDGDSYSDYAEYIAGTNPLDATSHPSTLPVVLGIPFIGWVIIIIVITVIVISLIYFLLSNKKRRRR